MQLGATTVHQFGTRPLAHICISNCLMGRTSCIIFGIFVANKLSMCHMSVAPASFPCDRGVITPPCGLGCGVWGVVVFSQGWRAQQQYSSSRAVNVSICRIGPECRFPFPCGRKPQHGAPVTHMSPGPRAHHPRARGMVIPVGSRLFGFLTECLVSLWSGLGKPYGVAFSLSGASNRTSWCTSLGCGVSHAVMPSLSESLVFIRSW